MRTYAAYQSEPEPLQNQHLSTNWRFHSRRFQPEYRRFWWKPWPVRWQPLGYSWGSFLTTFAFLNPNIPQQVIAWRLCVGTIARTFPLIENVAGDEALREVTELKFDCFIQQAIQLPILKVRHEICSVHSISHCRAAKVVKELPALNSEHGTKRTSWSAPTSSWDNNELPSFAVTSKEPTYLPLPYSRLVSYW